MRVLVFGAGVVGTTTAFYLAERGYEVEVVDGAERLASGASSANAGLLVPPDSVVWSSPRIPMLLLRSLCGRGHAVRIRRSAGPAFLPWGARFLRECSPQRYRDNSTRAHALSVLSYDELEALATRLSIEFAHQRNGMVFLYRRDRDLDRALASRRPLTDAGERYIHLGREELPFLDGGYRQIAPQLAGALYAPSAGHGDCVSFTIALARRCRALGVTFAFGMPVTSLDVVGGRVIGARVGARIVSADLYVVALGAWSPRLVATAGLRLPIVPARGHAATVPIVDQAAAPLLGGVDDDNHVAFSRIGDALRLTAAAEFAGYRRDDDGEARAHIRTVGDSLFPGALDWSRADYRSGLRPTTPDGLPRIGRTSLANLYLNSGHGHLGWTQACGSARVLADLIDGSEPPIDVTPYRASRAAIPPRVRQPATDREGTRCRTSS